MLLIIKMEGYKPPPESSSSDSDSDSDSGKKKKRKSKKKKQKVDPNRPKRPMSSYMFYTLAKRSDLKTEAPECN
jgi:hypothetical protein